eukprot:scaffold19692_cov46-Phaeocystis_antarctica.AAC.1
MSWTTSAGQDTAASAAIEPYSARGPTYRRSESPGSSSTATNALESESTSRPSPHGMDGMVGSVAPADSSPLTVAERYATHAISIVSIHSSLKSTGMSGE